MCEGELRVRRNLGAHVRERDNRAVSALRRARDAPDGLAVEDQLRVVVGHPLELQHAQRAIRMVRASAAEYGIAPDHLGMWGFSAGGHLTATAGTHFDAGNPSAADGIDQQSSRPDFLILAYPVITMMDPYVHTGSRKYLLGDSPDPALEQSMSAELQVTKDTPPTFLFSTTDDGTVQIMNSVMFYSALVKAGVPAEMHIFQHGSHGAGLAVTNPALSVWPDLLIKWMRERGYAAPAVATEGTAATLGSVQKH